MKPIKYLFCVFCVTITACSPKLDLSIEPQEITVDFFISPSHRAAPSTYETVTEQVLLVVEHHKGATFQDVTEEVLLKDGAITIGMKKRENYTFSIITNELTGLQEEISCSNFFGSQTSDARAIQMPPSYGSRVYKKVLKDGKGDLVKSSYGPRSYQKVVEEAHLELIDNSEREFVSYKFVIPGNISFEKYFMKQVDNRTFKLIEGVNYRIRN